VPKVAGVTRLRRRLDWLLARLLREPPDRMEPRLQMILRLGLYELIVLGVPGHAMGAYVDLAKHVVGGGTGALVNGAPLGAYRPPAAPLRLLHMRAASAARLWLPAAGGKGVFRSPADARGARGAGADRRAARAQACCAARPGTWRPAACPRRRPRRPARARLSVRTRSAARTATPHGSWSAGCAAGATRTRRSCWPATTRARRGSLPGGGRCVYRRAGPGTRRL
jgi:hypothetical protein